MMTSESCDGDGEALGLVDGLCDFDVETEVDELTEDDGLTLLLGDTEADGD